MPNPGQNAFTLNGLDTIGLHKDGREIAVSVSVSPITNAAGETIGAAGIARVVGEKSRRGDLAAVGDAVSAAVRVQSYSDGGFQPRYAPVAGSESSSGQALQAQGG